MAKNEKFEFSRTGGMGLPVQRHAMTSAKIQGRYIPFTGDGLAVETANNYPDVLAKVAADSPTHGGALDKKSKLTFGQGFNIKGAKSVIKKYLKKINADDDTANDVLERVCIDFVYYLGFCLRVRWAYDGKISEVSHVPFKLVRKCVPVDGKVTQYMVSNNWDNKTMEELQHNELINAFDPSKIIAAKRDEKTNKFERDDDGKIKVDDTTLDNAEQLIYFSVYSPTGSGFYPVPDYIAGLDSAFTEVETGVAMCNGVRNGINGAVILSSDDDGQSTDADSTLKIKKIASKGTGSANANNVYWVDSKVKATVIEPPKADVYKTVDDIIKNRIITAHGIPAILLEVSLGGGFNNRAEEMRAAIEQFQSTHILGYQQKIERVFNRVFKYMAGSEVEVNILPFELPEKEEKKEEKGAPETKEEGKQATDETNLRTRENQQ